MYTSTARPQLIDIPNKQISCAGLRPACYAALLYVLCVSAPVMYLANPAIRAYAKHDRIATTLIKNHLSIVHQKHLAVLAEAGRIEDVFARTAFLHDALKWANGELEGMEERSASLAAPPECSDTLFHRITGNRLLTSQDRDHRWHESCHELARQYVKDLNRALQLCSAP